MKKIKWTILSLAVILSVCGAFATRPHFDCSNMTQYFYSGGTYLPAGVEGQNYVCDESLNTCTYYTLNGQTFFACQTGTYCTGSCFVRETGRTPKPVEPATTPANTAKTH